MSTTATVWEQVFEFPHGSAPAHVRVAVKVTPQRRFVTVERTETLTFVPLAASSAVGA